MSEIMLSGLAPADGDTGPEVTPLGEGRMVREDCWREVHRLFHGERRSKAEIARQLPVDPKTGRGILDGAAGAPYKSPGRPQPCAGQGPRVLHLPAPWGPDPPRIRF